MWRSFSRHYLTSAITQCKFKIKLPYELVSVVIAMINVNDNNYIDVISLTILGTKLPGNHGWSSRFVDLKLIK